MRIILLTYKFIGFLLCFNSIFAQTIWTGEMTIFTKENNANWMLEINQDRITDKVWITRTNNQGIFNIASEMSYSAFSSPADTEWAIGTTTEIGNLTFDNWEDTSESNPPSLLNQDMVVHLISDDIYLDIKFLTWTQSSAGGGFSYQRSTDQNLSLEKSDGVSILKLYPNPSYDFIEVSGFENKKEYKIYNVLGQKVKKGTTSSGEPILIKGLSSGIYVLRIENYKMLKFIIRQ